MHTLSRILFSAIILAFSFEGMTQVPQKLSYQAIARNADGAPIASQSIGVKFSIHDNSPGGTVLFEETHQTTTNLFGLFTLAIGTGSPLTGSFPTVDWSTPSAKFLSVAIDPQGGSSYQIQGSTQFLSVPYALFAEKTKLVEGNAISITNGNTISANYQAGNAINITGNTISSNYQAGNAINITGNTISANYQPGNAINITGNTISANYQPGNGINITGNTISSALQAGSGITITGNVISSTAALQWTPDQNGIHYSSGNVAVGADSKATVAFSVMGNSSHDYTAELNSTNTWQTALNIYNATSSHRWALVTGGSANLMPAEGVGQSNFAIANDNTNSMNTTYPLIIGKDDKVGIGGQNGGSTHTPKAQLHVMTGDVYIEQVGKGVIMKSPNGQCWRMTVSNTGEAVFTAVTCP